MSKAKKPVPIPALVAAASFREPSEDEVRDYAYHLYQQGGDAPGHDVENWLEATACLNANIPANSSHSRLQLLLNGPRRNELSVGSTAAAERELAVLKDGREAIESMPTIADSDVRSSLFDDRP